MVHDDYKEMIPARALSALETADDRALSEHLSTCAECRKELETWASTAAALALTATPVEPTPRVRERILLEIRTELESVNSASKKSSEAAKVIPFVPPTKVSWNYIGSFAAIAAAVLFVALIASLIMLWQQNRNARIEVSTLSGQIRSTQEQLAHNQEVLAFVTAPGKTHAELAATNAAPGAHASIAYDKTGRTVLVVAGLAEVPAGKAYQLWYIVGKKPPIPGKLFATDRTGQGTLEDQLPVSASDNPVFAVTLEPATGSQSPTSDILLHSGS